LSFSIRQAEEKYLSQIKHELKLFSEFYNSKHSLYPNEDYLNDGLSEFFKNHLFLIAVDSEDKVLGLISGLIAPHIYNPSLSVLTESFWWVNPEYRNSRVGYALLDAFIEHGKKNCDWIITTLEDESPVKDSVFTERGFSFKEKSFLMEV
jgi:hypothetical protein